MLHGLMDGNESTGWMHGWTGMDALACRPPSPFLTLSPYLPHSLPPSLLVHRRFQSAFVVGLSRAKSLLPLEIFPVPSRPFPSLPTPSTRPSTRPFAHRLSPVTRQAVTRHLRCRTEYSSVVYRSVARCGVMRGNAVRCHAAYSVE